RAARDAAGGGGWEIVPLIKVGRDMAAPAERFLRSLRHVAAGARFVLVPEANNRVTLRYETKERRCELMSGGVPAWAWEELGPNTFDLDALYVNFISGFEMTLDTARMLRRGFTKFIYADLHSLFLAKRADGLRTLQPLPDGPGWFGCFDAVQLNEEEMGQLAPAPLALAAGALAAGTKTLCVTLGRRGAAYFTGSPVRTARVSSEETGAASFDEGDPTGCGDVFGATAGAALVQGAPVEDALRLAARRAARNVAFRGASGLRDHLLGKL